MWDRGELAIVHACGSPDATRSHFDAQDYMETGTPGVKSTGDGWLNRYLQARRGRARKRRFARVALTPQLPRMLQGRAPALAMNQIGQFGIRGGRPTRSARRSKRSTPRPPIAMLNGAGREAFDAMKTLKAADPARYRPEHGAEYPRSPFGQALRQIAQLTKADVGLEVAFAEIGGWDTHVNQGAAQGQLAGTARRLSRAASRRSSPISAIAWRDIVVADDVGVRARRERERQPRHRPRARQRDDGDRAAACAAAGSTARWPGLAADRRFEGRDLAVTTDFRDVFGEIVVRHWA